MADEPGTASKRRHPRHKPREAPRALPFLKWAGGKTQLLPQLLPMFPQEIPDYVEPFVGSGAVFFALHAAGRLTGQAVLADVNEELINAYRAVQTDVHALIELLLRHRAEHSRDHYYAVRQLPFEPGTEGAARTIYLNKTGFNGLYRVNRSGRFNVPMGRYRNPSILNPETLLLAAEALSRAELRVCCFRDLIAQCDERHLLYLDPPYVPLSPSSSFTAYSSRGFGAQDQCDLAESLRELDSRGGRFVLSNSHTDLVRELYEGFHLRVVPARRYINSVPSRRGPIEELVAANFR